MAITRNELKEILAGIGVYAMLVGASAVIAALLMACTGCIVRDESAPQARRNINVDVDVNLRRPCPPGRPCPRDDRLRRSIGLPDSAMLSTERPAVDLPVESRCRNYNGGSCVCASTISVLRWQGREDLADRLRSICSGGQSSGSIIAKMERLELPYAYTNDGDAAFLDWSCQTRRGATIFWKPGHSCTLVGLTEGEAIVLDNNHVWQYERTPRDEFIRRWRGYGGFALTPLAGSPAPPPMHTGWHTGWRRRS
jgi:hypothetical protein